MKPNTVESASNKQKNHERIQPRHTGFIAGTIILTADGEVPVQYLVPGDRVITRNKGFVELRDTHLARANVHAVKVTGGALGQSRPNVNVILPTSQQVLVRGWRAYALSGQSQAILPAGCLIDGDEIIDLGERTMTLVQIGFDTACIVYADGMELSVPALAQPAAIGISGEDAVFFRSA